MMTRTSFTKRQVFNITFLLPFGLKLLFSFSTESNFQLLRGIFKSSSQQEKVSVSENQNWASKPTSHQLNHMIDR